MQQLDQEGKRRVMTLLKGLEAPTVLMVGQKESFETDHAAQIHTVRKKDGCAVISCC